MKWSYLLKFCSLIGCVALSLIGGCAGEGQECLDDESGSTMDTAVDMGVLRQLPLVPDGRLVAEGVLQTDDDVDWFRFAVVDHWAIVWWPKIRLSVFPEPGTSHNKKTFRVEIFNSDGDFVGEMDGSSMRLRGSSFFDDGIPYFARVTWRDSAYDGETEVRRLAPDESPTPTPTPTETPEAGDPIPSPTPSVSPTEVVSVSTLRCTRYLISVSN